MNRYGLFYRMCLLVCIGNEKTLSHIHFLLFCCWIVWLHSSCIVVRVARHRLLGCRLLVSHFLVLVVIHVYLSRLGATTVLSLCCSGCWICERVCCSAWVFSVCSSSFLRWLPSIPVVFWPFLWRIVVSMSSSLCGLSFWVSFCCVW